MGNVANVKVAKIFTSVANVVMDIVKLVIRQEVGFHLHVAQIFSLVQNVPNIFGMAGVFLVENNVVQLVVNYVGNVMWQHAKNVFVWEKGIVVKSTKMFSLSCK